MMTIRKQTSIFLLLSGLSIVTMASDCSFYIPFKENSGIEYQSFNHRDRLQGSQRVTVVKVEDNAGETIATMRSESFDQRDKELFQSEFMVTCTGNQIMIDIQSLLDANMMQGFQGMEMEIESTDIILPGKLTVGQQLPEAEMRMKVSTSGMTIADMTLRMANRTVDGMETITVPAGTFECYKISYDLLTETRSMGIPMRINAKVIEYHAPNQGAVRSENYDERDRLQGYTVLSKVF
jgi:hypothetical protein